MRTARQGQRPGHLQPAPAARTCTPHHRTGCPRSLQTRSQVPLLTEDEAARLMEAPGGHREEFLLCLGGTYPIPPKAPRDLAHPVLVNLPPEHDPHANGTDEVKLGGGEWSLPSERGSPTFVNSETLSYDTPPSAPPPEAQNRKPFSGAQMRPHL